MAIAAHNVLLGRAKFVLVLIALSLVMIAVNANASLYRESVTLAAKSERYAQVAPAPRTFVVTVAGRYRMTVTDVGFPAALTSVDVVVTKGINRVVRLAQVGTQEFDATPGTYSVHVLGQSATAGSAGVTIQKLGDATPLLEYQVGVVSNPTASGAGRSTFSHRIDITSAGNYQIALTDRRFPSSLATFDLLVLSANGTPATRLCQPAIPNICDSTAKTFAASVGSYDVFVNALAASSFNAGLYSIKISNASSTEVYGVTNPVGTLESHAFLEFPASGQYELTLKDLEFPASLANISAVIAQGSEVVTSVASATTQSFNVARGPATLYTIAEPNSSDGVGAYGVYLPNGTQTLYSDAQAVVANSASGVRAYAFLGSFPAAGTYRVEARDFGFPVSIPSLQLLVTQNGAPLGAVTSGGSLTVPAKAGPFMLVAIANMSSAAAIGLFGATVSEPATNAEVLTVTQGVGDLFSKQTFSATMTGNLDVTLNDIGWPTPFEDLAVVVTRGNALVGQIFGGGTFSFPAEAGTYTLNVVARSANGSNYGLYGAKIEDAAPTPTVTFSASALTVPLQGSTTVNWSTTDATGCTASGAWSGAKPISGSNVTVGPFAADAVLTLNCSGPGGDKMAQVKILVAQAPEAESAGAFAWWQLVSLLSLLLLATSRQTSLRRRIEC